MNTPISAAAETALRKQVERAVRPVLATEKRKLRMREELLAHLTAIFVEEHQQLGDETVALAKSRGRFGNPAELTAELNRSVGPWQRFAAAGEHWERWLDKTLTKRKDESLSRYAMRSLMSSTVLAIGMMVAVCGIVWTIGGLPDSGTLFMLPRLFPLMIVSEWSLIVATAYVDSSTTTGSHRWSLLFLLSAVCGLIWTAVAASFWWSISERGIHGSCSAFAG